MARYVVSVVFLVSNRMIVFTQGLQKTGFIILYFDSALLNTVLEWKTEGGFSDGKIFSPLGGDVPTLVAPEVSLN